MAFARDLLRHFPVKLLAASLVFSILLMAGIGWNVWTSYDNFQNAQARNSRLLELTGVISHLDETLTMSARMAAATGDLSWEARYNQFEPQLGAAIDDAQRLAPDVYAGDAAQQTNVANVKLVAMERRSFDLVRAGQPQAAAAILSGPDYADQKQVYAAGNLRVAQLLKTSGRASVSSAQRAWLIAIFAVGAPMLSCVWLPAIFLLSRHAAARHQAEEALQQAFEQERQRARRDSLTGVLNHGAIVQELTAIATADGERSALAVAMVDVDGLKEINDTYGHPIGDAVLIAVANALSRDGAIVGRYGGDEFAVIIPGADPAASERYRQETLRRLRNVTLAGPSGRAPVPVRASIGIAHCPGDASTVADLITLSDSAMFATRRNRTVRPASGMAAAA